MVTRPSLVGPIIDVSPSLTERAIEAVRLAIRNGAMVPGELYTVNQLATELGVSRSPVRDARVAARRNRHDQVRALPRFRLQLPGPQDLAQIFGGASGAGDPRGAQGGRPRDRRADRRTEGCGGGAPEGGHG